MAGFGDRQRCGRVNRPGWPRRRRQNHPL